MRKKLVVVLAGFFILLSSISVVIAQTAPPSDPKKHTEAGKYVTSPEAYEMWKANPEKVKILDCRIQEEYAFVGHPAMAYNIPSRLWTGKWNEEKKDYDLQDNPDFEAQVSKKLAKEDTILVMCRSGHRSAASVNRLTKAGFKNVYNIVDGFEGDKISDAESYFNGKRMKNGWKNSSAPWTYDLDPKLVYSPQP
jgi:rhodanese-related sulfurtransferase